MPARQRTIGRGVSIPPAVAAAASAPAARALGTITLLGIGIDNAFVNNNATGSISPAANGMLVAVVEHNAPNAELDSINTGTLSGTWTQYQTRFSGGSSGLYFSVYTCKDYGTSGTVKAVKTNADGLRVLVFHCSVQPVGTIKQHKDFVSTSTTTATATLDAAATRECIGVGHVGNGSAFTGVGGSLTELGQDVDYVQYVAGSRITAGGTNWAFNWTGNSFAHAFVLELDA